MSAFIEDYGLIGDGRTVSLIARDGSLDWLCWPRFDSEACFAKLLGSEQHGRWLIGSGDPHAHISRRYRPDTLVLETSFHSAEGVAQLVDFMPIYPNSPAVVRMVIGLRGSVPMHCIFAPRFEYGHLLPWVEPHQQGLRVKMGSHRLTLASPVPLQIRPEQSSATFSVAAGQRLAFVLRYGCEPGGVPATVTGTGLLPQTERQLADTERSWREWVGRFQRPTDWPEAVRRSLLTLKALIYRPTGGLIAAPTTSLPEKPGGALNWDYRYSWLRDSTFTLTALLNAGYHEEARAWREWLLAAIGGEPAKLQTAYRVDGNRGLVERAVPWLPGFAGSTPVRVGNTAAYQHQHDVYGEIINCLELARRAGIPQSAHAEQVERGIIEQLERVWARPGQGIWESRAEAKHYTYPRVMAWVGVDRFLRNPERHWHASAELRARLGKLRASIHDDILRHGYDPGLGRFVEYYGGQEIGASLLLLPLVGFIRANDPRMARTIAAVERELTHDGLVTRSAKAEEHSHAAFLACSCWLADCQRLQQRTAAARATLERVLAVRNDLGLLSEQYSLSSAQLCGNFPQALSHLALVNAALALCGPVLQPGGG